MSTRASAVIAIALALSLPACGDKDTLAPAATWSIDYDALGPMRVLLHSSAGAQIADGRTRRVTVVSSTGEQQALSPDASALATRQRDTRGCNDPTANCLAITVTDFSNSDSRVVGRIQSAIPGSPAFTNDGSGVVFGWSGPAGSGLIRARRDGSGQTAVASWPRASQGPQACPYFDILFDRVAGDAQGHIVFDCRGLTLFVAGPAPGALRELVAIDTSAPNAPRWRQLFTPTISPDGQRVAFLQGDPQSTYAFAPIARLMTIPLAGGSATEHARFPTTSQRDITHCWGPDGQRILVAYRHESGVRVVAVRLSDGSRRTVAEVQDGAAWVSCAA
jgi:hypothetical protein